ncbi:hypothetical protein, partial [Stackebrandtia soli]|uniref:hypothetical protein n=1 Tax=Stackebrandtia soli TaxID=1892856 RepID=UPI0039ED6A98
APAPPPSTPSESVSAPVDASDPAIPGDALPGWVYTDADENWYLVLAMADGSRLMRLSDFALIPVGALSPDDLTLAGSIEMTVWPTDSEEPASEPAATPVDDPPDDEPGTTILRGRPAPSE